MGRTRLVNAVGKRICALLLAHACVAAPTVGLAQAYVSPSQEFEQKMAPLRKPDFLLPAEAESAGQRNGGVAVMDVGRRQPLYKPGDDSNMLLEEQRRQATEETRLNRTYSEPKIERPQPKSLSCSGNPPLCVER